MCALCRGAGNRFVVQSGALEWWTCQACGGAGVRSLQGPASVHSHARGFYGDYRGDLDNGLVSNGIVQAP